MALLLVVGWEEPVPAMAQPAPPAVIHHRDVGDDVVGVEGDFVTARSLGVPKGDGCDSEVAFTLVIGIYLPLPDGGPGSPQFRRRPPARASGESAAFVLHAGSGSRGPCGSAGPGKELRPRGPGVKAASAEQVEASRSRWAWA